MTKATRKEYNRQYREKHKARLQVWNKAWRDANPDYVKRKNLEKTGFTPELLAAALAAQSHCCAICGRDLRALPRKHIHADHCHDTGLPRGVLRHYCNLGLGHFSDDVSRLRRAIYYLETSPTTLA